MEKTKERWGQLRLEANNGFVRTKLPRSGVVASVGGTGCTVVKSGVASDVEAETVYNKKEMRADALTDEVFPFFEVTLSSEPS